MKRRIDKKVGDQFLRSHTKWLRKGDTFKMFFGDGTDVELVALSDPYIDQRSKEWSVDIKEPHIDDRRA